MLTRKGLKQSIDSIQNPRTLVARNALVSTSVVFIIHAFVAWSGREETENVESSLLARWQHERQLKSRRISRPWNSLKEAHPSAPYITWDKKEKQEATGPKRGFGSKYMCEAEGRTQVQKR